MHKKILAFLLGLTLFLSMMPMAQAFAGQITEFGISNLSTGNGSMSGNRTLTSFSNGVNTITLSADYEELFKSSQVYYVDYAVKYKVYIKIDVTGDSELAEAIKTNARVNGAYIPSSRIDVQGTDALIVTLAELTLYAEDTTVDYTFTYPYGSGVSESKFRFVFKNMGAAPKGAKPLYVKPSSTGDEGVYSLYVNNGVVFIDYANDISTPDAIIPVNFRFYEDASSAVRVPASGQRAYVRTGSGKTNAGTNDGKNFFVGSGQNARVAYTGMTTSANASVTVPATGGAAVDYNEAVTLGVWLPTASGTENRTMRIYLEGKDYAYQSSDIKVVFRPVPRNQISTVVTPVRNLTVAVGSTIEVTVESASVTSYSNLTLQAVSGATRVYIDGKKITGLSVGTAQIQIKAGSRTVEQLTVTVTAAAKAAGTPAPAATPKPGIASGGGKVAVRR